MHSNFISFFLGKNVCQHSAAMVTFKSKMALFYQMNYLAHAFLSFSNGEILTGNVISDFVKGKSKFTYPSIVQKGITLHRMIDRFTDDHPITTEAKEIFRPQYRLYCGAFMDIVYDHFLALDEKQFAAYGGLKPFTKKSYILLDEHFSIFPLHFQKMFPYMKTENWLYNYRSKNGIRKGFEGLVYRAAYLHESEIAFSIFNEHYEGFKNYYNEFFPELKQYAYDSLSNLMAE